MSAGIYRKASLMIVEAITSCRVNTTYADSIPYARNRDKHLI